MRPPAQMVIKEVTKLDIFFDKFVKECVPVVIWVGRDPLMVKIEGYSHIFGISHDVDVFTWRSVRWTTGTKVIRHVTLECSRSRQLFNVKIRIGRKVFKPGDSSVYLYIILYSIVPDEPDYLLHPGSATCGIGDHPHIQLEILNIGVGSRGSRGAVAPLDFLV